MTILFLKIVNMGISAGWLILVVILLRLLLKKAPKWLNVALWGLAWIRLAVPFSIESIFSLIPSSETISPEIAQTHAPTINTGIPALNQAVNPIISTSLAPAPGDSVNPLQIWIPVFSVIWIVGMVFLFSYTVISYLRLCRRVATAIPLKDNIYQSERVDSPFVLGIIRPRIYLPFHLEKRDEISIIAHEQAHIRRRDHWWKPLGFLLLTVHWFNPLVWVAYVLLCRDIELACDEKVIRELDNEQRAEYSQALLACSVRPKSIAACPLAFGETGVKERVRSVLNYRKPAFWIIAAAVIVCGAVALCFLTDPAGRRDTMVWAQELSADMVVSADLVDYHQTEEKQFMRLSEADISVMVALINQCDGRYLDEHEDERPYNIGGSIFFYLTLQDGTTHSVGNIGNTYLRIDEDSYKAEYKWLSTWDDYFREGNAPLPEGYSFGQQTFGEDAGIEAGDDLFSDGNQESLSLQRMVVWEDADLDHDGERETIYVREIRAEEAYELEVVKKDGTLLWVSDTYSPHLEGPGVILLYQSGGEDYLVKYHVPYMYPGIEGTINCTCTQFSLEGGVETEENQWTADFELPVSQITGKMRAFAEVGNMIMKDGTVLLGTVQANLVLIGPKAATELPQLYPVRFYPDEMDNNMASGENLFAGIQPLKFVFASGAGGWGTTLTLYPDGHFEGVYEDGENIAAPDYPRGTTYICEFSGQFSEMTRISEYAYSMQLAELTCETEVDKIWIEDGIRYIGSDAFGIDGGEEFILYLPYTSPEGLDEEFLSWWPDNYLWRDGSVKTLASYAIQNVNTGQGFFTSWLQ